MFLALIVPAIALIAAPGSKSASRQADFELDVRTRELLAGGPLVLDIQLVHRGEQPCYTYALNTGSFLGVTIEQERKAYVSPAPRNTVDGHAIKWNSATSHKLQIFAGHHGLVRNEQDDAERFRIEPGFAKVTVNVQLRRPQYGGNGLTVVEVAELSTSTLVFLTPQMSARLANAEHTRWHQLDQIITHWCSPDKEDPNVPLKELAHRSDLWMQTFAYLKYGDRTESTWRQKLLTELEENSRIPVDAILRQMAGELDAPSFAVRTEARRALERSAPQIESWLRQLRSPKLSNEADHQIEMILRKIETSEVKERSEHALRDLEMIAETLKPKPGEPIMEVLQALARPNSICSTCVEAERILKKLKADGK